MNRILAPIRKNIALFLVFALLLGIGSALDRDISDGSFHFAKAKFVFGMLQGCFFSLIILYVVSWAKWRKTVTGFFLALSGILCFVEIFCSLQLATRLNSNTVNLILQSDARESGEFVLQYIFQLKTILAFVLTAGIIFTYFPIKWIASHIRLGKLGNIFLILIGILSSLSILVAFYPEITHGRTYDFRSTPIQLFYAVGDIKSTRQELKQLEHTTQILKVDSVGYKPENIVLIIGESYNKHHATPYGYRLNTTPNLNKEIERGNMFVFSDIVSRHQYTAEALHEIFSTDIESKHESWASSPLLTSAFKKAGYKVRLYDNHSSMINTSDWDFSSTYFMNVSFINDSLDFRNNDIYQFDHMLIDEMEQLDCEHSPTLTIVHLMGQHMPAEKRYPDNFEIFTTKDYPDNFSQSQKNDLMHYDNATAYNDYVVKRIIDTVRDREAVVVYLSDHGEEVHDFRDQYGRKQEPLNLDIVRCLYQVPFLIWVSDKYKMLHPEMVENIKVAVDRKGANGDVAQLLLHLGNIYAPFADRSFSIISPEYKQYPRVLNGTYKYD